MNTVAATLITTAQIATAVTLIQPANTAIAEKARLSMK